MNKIAFIKSVDSFLGPVLIPLVARLFSPRKAGSGSIDKVLLIRPGGIGDAVLLIPALRALKSRFPDATIHILAEKRNAGVFSLSQDVERVYQYDRPMELLSAIREPYDVIIDTEQWHRLSAVVARLIRAPMSVGFSTNERRKLFTHPAPYAHEDYETDSFLHLIEPLIGTAVFDPTRPFLAVPEKDRSQVEPYLRSLSNTRIVALFPGGSIPERRWGSERFHAVAEQLNKRGCGVVVIGGKDDYPAGEGIVRGVPSSLNLCGRLSLAETAAVISLSSLLITGDSGIMHLGYAVGANVLALFGPGIEKKWAPQSPRVAILNRHLPCSPCTEYGYTPTCTRGAACMKEISVEEVIESSLALLDKE